MNEMTQHRVAVKATLGATLLDVNFTLDSPWTVLFGPSGCGKTSILRALGGTLPNAIVEFARGSASGGWEELSAKSPDCRSLAYAPQSGAIFPHLTVQQNVAFPYSVCREPARQAAQAEEAMSLFALHSLSERMPKDLSGGERQRVNLARAFATPGACLMMLDEPFAGLDRERRDELLPAMKQWCAEKRVQVLSVTHDIDEALQLGAHVIRLRNGKVAAEGAARDVLEQERERLIAVLS